MAQIYAGILGLLAFLTCLTRGLMQGNSANSIIWSACLSLPVFAAIGYAIGWLAGRTIEDSIQAKLRAEVAAEEAGRPAARSAHAGAGT